MTLSPKNNTIKRSIFHRIPSEGIFITVLGFSFSVLLFILRSAIENTNISVIFIYGTILLTLLFLFPFLINSLKEFIKKQGQLLLFYFGIGIMAAINYLQFINNFSDHFIFFYWTMAVSVSLGISNFRLQIQIWAIPLIMVLFAAYYADITEAEKMQFYIWNPVITIMSCFGVYNSVKTKKSLKNYKRKAEKFEFEYENLLETMPTMVVFKDDKNTVLRINRKQGEMLGQDVKSFNNLNLYDVEREEDALAFHKEDLEIINTGKAKLNVIEKMRLPNKEEDIWLRIDKKPYYNQKNEICGVIIFSHDITAEVNAKIEKEKTETQFEQVFSEAPYGIIIFNEAEEILQVNSTFEKMIGFEKSEIINFNISKIISEQSIHTKRESLNMMNGFQKELEFRTKDGTNFIGKLSVSLVKNANEKLNYSIGIIEDITEKKNAEQKLADYAEALQQSNKDLEQFAYAASHDLREPLRMVHSYVSLIEKMYRSKLDVQGLEFINYATDGVKRMDLLIKNLLEYSRIGRSELKEEVIVFDNLITKVMNNLRVPINKKKVDFDFDINLKAFKANNVLISMLFQNIISNGIKYNNNQPLIEIKGKIIDQKIHFTIADNGIGIDEKFNTKVFQVFQRLHTKEQYEGTGIGLAICKRIIQKHGGEIWLESEVGKGSTFYFTIPYKEVTT